MPSSFSNSEKFKRSCTKNKCRTRTRRTQTLMSAEEITPRMQPVEIYLNSKNGTRLGTYHDKVFFNLPRPVISPEGYQMYLSVQSFTCPVSWYIVHSNNCTLFVNDVPYVLPWGNYKIVDLVNALKLSLPLNVFYNSINNKVTLSSGAYFNVYGGLCRLLGIAEGSGGMTVTSLHTIDLTGVNSIYVVSNFTGNNIDSAGPGQTVICRVPVTEPPLGVVQYSDQACYAGIIMSDDVLSSIELTLEDEDRLPLQATIFWEMTLQVSFIKTGIKRMVVDRPAGLQAPPTII
ncbi:hypothetical protein JKP88DRAFT_248918 [Tribonema minus]|uniref:Uncharacterized protein n=1 Tax=Tribonema minus TaxID=303371 RepID=A0A835YNT9_9STRA|nr:hypothetical protein JKP88DRAFT_248918 [Tribonema minus]